MPACNPCPEETNTMQEDYVIQAPELTLDYLKKLANLSTLFSFFVISNKEASFGLNSSKKKQDEKINCSNNLTYFHSSFQRKT